jgi:hypothetical protein
MEELVGGKGEKVLPYALKEYFLYNEEHIDVVASEVLLELENHQGEVVTLRRAIRDTARDTKLVEVFKVAHITGGEDLGQPTPMYLFDAGSAKRQEGFHRYLENFMGLELPRVGTTSGGETKLYLQAVFAALAVEQKRGWTDYIANIPFYGIRDARTRVTEFLLALGVFEREAERNKLDVESVAIANDWRRVYDELRQAATVSGVLVEGVGQQPTALMDASAVSLLKPSGNTKNTLNDYVIQLRSEYQELTARADANGRLAGTEALEQLDAISEELQNLSVLHELASSNLLLEKASLHEYQALLTEAKEDLARNKTALKLRSLGAQFDVELATGHCPTCHQDVDDTLLIGMVSGPQMDLQASIGYLESQCRMLKQQITGVQESVRQLEVTVADLGAKLATKHDYRNALRGDVSAGASESRAIVRRQVQIEIELTNLERLEVQVAGYVERFQGIAARLTRNQAARKALPKEIYNQSDLARISLFQKQFRANASAFGYESAEINDIEISTDTLTPALSKIELREIIAKPRADIKADSSASDFVRLIWSYLLALYQTSATRGFEGHHPGMLMFDEPGQHSMRSSSQHALLQLLSGATGLQSIVAASFDENESVFKEATAGLRYQLIEWSGKVIRPL